MQLVPITNQTRSNMNESVEILNKENKKSVYNLMPFAMKRIIDDRHRKVLDYLKFDERDLKSELGDKLTPTVNRLRYSFWNEFYRSVDNGRDQNNKMLVKNIHGGVCSKEAYDRYLNDDMLVAWILCPPSDTVVALQETLNYGLERIREMLELPLYKIESVRVGPEEWEDREVVDEKVANLMLKAVAMIDLRLHGSYVQVQKIQQNITTEHTPLPREVVGEVRDVDKELLELRKELGRNVSITYEEGDALESAGFDVPESYYGSKVNRDKGGKHKFDTEVFEAVFDESDL